MSKRVHILKNFMRNQKLKYIYDWNLMESCFSFGPLRICLKIPRKHS